MEMWYLTLKGGMVESDIVLLALEEEGEVTRSGDSRQQ